MKKDVLRSSPRPQTVAEYIRAEPKVAQKRLREMRACLRKAAPGAVESLKWNMPALSYQRILFMYAAFKNHLSLFPTAKAIRAFKARLSKYKTSAGTIQFPLDKPLPLALIRQIARFRVQESKERDAKWM
jgi:uncharacterized protein YdhG (YjbR/CyaY superfamily)